MFFSRLAFSVYRHVSTKSLYKLLIKRCFPCDVLFALSLSPHIDRRAFAAYKILRSLRSQYTSVEKNMTNTGTIVFFTPNDVIYFSGGKTSDRTLQFSFKNHAKYSQGWFAKYLDYGLSRSEVAEEKVYVCSRLSEADICAKESFVQELYDAQNNNRLDSDLSTSQLEQMVAYLWLEFSEYSLFQETIELLSNSVFSWVHGDLYPENIMANENGDLVLIDLDRMSAFDPIVDQINFILIPLQNRLGISWIKIVSEHLSQSSQTYKELQSFKRDDLLKYVFFRLYFDIKLNTGATRQYLKQLYTNFYASN